MQAATIRHSTYYRCLSKTIAPGSPVLAEHPVTVNLREDTVLKPLNAWIAELFSPGHRDKTIEALVAADDQAPNAGLRHHLARERLAGAEGRLRRHEAAIEAGVDPTALVEVINEAQAQRAAARAELASLPTHRVTDRAEIEALVNGLGDMAATLTRAAPDHQIALYQALRLDLRYHHRERAVYVTATPRMVSACPRGT